MNKSEPIVTKNDIRNFWEENFLYSFEVKSKQLNKEFFLKLDSIKANDVEVFSSYFWEFQNSKGLKVLDVGCGNGWLVRNYAKNNANIIGVDLTFKAASLTKKSLELFGYFGKVLVSDAEKLPFKDNCFDLISCSRVLHHTVNPELGIKEIFRVLKPQGIALVSLYYKNLLLKKYIFPPVLFLFNLLKVSPPGRNHLRKAKSVDDFVRMYDGDKNPKGIAYNKKECKKFFQQFKILKMELHFFPLRFYKAGFLKIFHRFLDRFFGLMIYVKLEK